MRAIFLGLAAMMAAALPATAQAQATTRPCTAAEEPGPACLLAHQMLPALPQGPLFWQLDRFASPQAAQGAAMASSAVVTAFGSTWLFTLAPAQWRPHGGAHVSTIGPLPIEPASSYAVEYLRSVFTPGTTAP